MTDREHRDPDVVRTEYDPGSDESLSVLIVEAIEEHENRDLSRSEFVLYDDVNPDALDDLFRARSTADTSVQFETDDVSVSLWGDGTVHVVVTDRE